MKPTPELIYEYRMSRERAEREARERREAACTAIPRLREIADQRRRLAFDTGLMIMRGEDSSELRNKVEQLDKEELNLPVCHQTICCHTIAVKPVTIPVMWGIR